MEGIIYCYTSPSGKKYIGQTTRGDKRKLEHIRNSKNVNSYNYNCKFYTALRKYGFDSFKYEVLYTVIDDDEEKVMWQLNKLECYYIGLNDSFRNGYNQSIGGDTNGFGIFHPSYGKKLSEGHKEKLHNSTRRPVCQYDLNGNFIKEYKSMAEAEECTGIADSLISACCLYKSKSAGGYQWRYKGDKQPGVYKKYTKPLKQKHPNKDKWRKVYKYDLDNNLIAIYDSLTIVSNELDVNTGTMHGWVKRHKIIDGFYYSFNKIDYAD